MKRKSIILFAFALFVIFTLPGRARAEYTYSSSCPWSFQATGTITGNISVSMCSDEDYTDNVLLLPGTDVTVTGGRGEYYHVVSPEGKTGFILKKQISLGGTPLKRTAAASLHGTLKAEDPLPVQESRKDLSFSGSMQASVPTDCIFLFLWDERSMSLEGTWFLQMEKPQKVIQGSELNGIINTGRIKAGRKMLVVQGCMDGEPDVLARVFFSVRGHEEEPYHITDQCGAGLPETVTDSNLYTFWEPDYGTPSLTVHLPAGAALLTLEWKTPPDSFTCRCADRNGTVLNETVYRTGFFLDSLCLDSGISTVSIIPEGKCALSTLRVYPEEYAEFAVQKWETLPDKVDLMLFATHQDDELLFFGGMIPYYCSQGKTVAVAYMTDCGRSRYKEALDGLWTTGLKYYPVFIGWMNGQEDLSSSGRATTRNFWTNKTYDPVTDLVRVIRKYRPDVVVTHDFSGEYRNIQHQLTARLIAEAAVLAGDPGYDKDAGIPAWEVRKVYIHLYEENRIYMDWNKPLNDEQAITPLFLATEAFDKHHSQHIYNSMEVHGVRYDNQCFGLYYSSVGEDKKKDDLFENIE